MSESFRVTTEELGESCTASESLVHAQLTALDFSTERPDPRDDERTNWLCVEGLTAKATKTTSHLKGKPFFPFPTNSPSHLLDSSICTVPSLDLLPTYNAQ